VRERSPSPDGVPGLVHSPTLTSPPPPGSGIFPHQQTAGCVSLGHKDLVAVLRWLRPGTRIAMGPAGHLNNRL
jgi:hypothetical protein